MPFLRLLWLAPCDEERRRAVAIRIGIDLMGSDRGPIELFQALVQLEEQLPEACTLVAIAPEGNASCNQQDRVCRSK